MSAIEQAVNKSNADAELTRENDAYATVQQQIKEEELGITEAEAQVERMQDAIRQARKTIRQRKDNLRKLRSRRRIFDDARHRLQRLAEE